MSDYEKLPSAKRESFNKIPKTKLKRKKDANTKHDRDDMGGMMLNMIEKLDGRELIIIWVVYIFIHSELFAEKILNAIFTGAINENKTMTLRGMLLSSLLMLLVVIICHLVF